MIVTNLGEEERRQLAAMFVSGGWNLLKQDLEKRKTVLVNDLIDSVDRDKDADRRAMIHAINRLLAIEREIFLPIPSPEQEAFRIPVPNVNRYGNVVS